MGWRGEDQELVSGRATFEMPIAHPGGDVGYVVESTSSPGWRENPRVVRFSMVLKALGTDDLRQGEVSLYAAFLYVR